MERNEQIETLRRKSCWVLAGHYIDDMTITKYTLDELEAWRWRRT